MPKPQQSSEPSDPGPDNEGRSNVVIIDGSNVAMSSEGERGVLENILIVRGRLEEDGFEPVILVDAALRHRIDDSAEYERLVDEGVIRQAPAGTDADYFILSFADELGASVVSNDRFKDRIAKYPAVSKRLIKYMIVQGEVVFEKRNGRRE